MKMVPQDSLYLFCSSILVLAVHVQYSMARGTTIYTSILNGKQVSRSNSGEGILIWLRKLLSMKK